MLKLALTIFFLGACVASDPRTEFENFKTLHERRYTSLKEEEERFQYFKENLAKIEKHNSEGHSWRIGVTKFADMPK